MDPTLVLHTGCMYNGVTFTKHECPCYTLKCSNLTGMGWVSDVVMLGFMAPDNSEVFYTQGGLKNIDSGSNRVAILTLGGEHRNPDHTYSRILGSLPISISYFYYISSPTSLIYLELSNLMCGLSIFLEVKKSSPRKYII